MKVYVAGASSGGGLDRAELWVKRLRDEGIHVTCTWPKSIRAHKVGANSPAWSQRKCSVLARGCVREVLDAHVLWFHLPKDVTTSGAWVELGVAFTGHKRIVLSGDNASVFTGLADDIYDDDQTAFDALVAMHELVP